MTELPIKKVGHCSLCDEPVMEVVQKFGTGPRKGDVQLWGPPKDGAYRTTFILRSGIKMDYSFCVNCEAQAEDVPVIWRKMLRAMKLSTDDEWRRVRESPPYTPTQRKAADDGLQELVDDPPLGILYTQLLIEVLNG